jgi:hypothetical protein
MIGQSEPFHCQIPFQVRTTANDGKRTRSTRQGQQVPSRT